MKALAALASACIAFSAAAADIVQVRDINRTVRLPDQPARAVAVGSRFLLSLCDDSDCRPYLADADLQDLRAIPGLATGPRSGDGGTYVVAGPNAYFSARDTSAAWGLWRTDGTAAGTVKVGDFGPLSGGMAAVGTTLYFLADNSLWRTQGQPNDAVRIADAPSGSDLVNLNGTLLFSAFEQTIGKELWVSDGTQAGTHVLKDIYPGLTSSSPTAFVALDTRVVFLAVSSFASGAVDIWSTDGTAGGTVKVGQYTHLGRSNPVRSGSQYFLLTGDGSGMELIASDGTAAGTTTLVSSGKFAGIVDLVPVGGSVHFVSDEGTGPQLWRTDGTQPGTVRVTDFPGYANVNSLVGKGDSVYFNALSGPMTFMYKSSPASGTQPVATTYGKPRMELAGHLLATVASSTVTNAAFDADPFNPTRHAVGTPSAQVLLEGASPDQSLLSPLLTVAGEPNRGSFCGTQAASLGGFIYFAANDDVHGCELWRSNGTAGGTTLVKDLVPGIDGGMDSPISRFVAASGAIYFLARDGDFPALWKTNGTASGTVAVAGPTTPWHATEVVAAGAGAYVVDHPSKALWRTDGTSATLVDAARVSSKAPPAFLGNRLYYLVESAAGGYDLKATDGVQVSSLHHFDTWTTGQGFQAMGQGAAFIAPNPAFGTDLWRSDGTAQGTAIVKANATFIAGTFDDAAIFAAYGTSGFAEAWRSDGTAAGTYRFSTACPPSGFGARIGNRFFYTCGVSIYSTDGTDAGTRFVSGVNALLLRGVVAAGGSLFFTTSENYGTYVWRSDGLSPQGTRILLPAMFGVLVDRADSLRAGLFLMGSVNGPGFEPYLVPSLAPPSPRKGLAPDLDADAIGDILWRHPASGSGAWLMDSSGFHAAGGIPAPASGAVVVNSGDFDGDGKTDLLWRTGNGTYWLTLQDGLTVTASKKLLDGGTGWEVVAKGDFNGDGRTDLVWAGPSGEHRLALMNGTSDPAYPMIADASLHFSVALVADFNGDGKSDIVWTGSDGSATMFLMDGVTITEQKQLIGGGTGWTAAFFGDLDGDGAADLIWRHTDGRHGIWFMHGTTAWTYATLIDAGTGWNVRFVRDIDGDGKSDVVWSHTDGSYAAWLMAGGAAKNYRLLLGAGTGWSVVASEDYDGDGKEDLLWRGPTGAYALWLMDGVNVKSYRSILDAGTGWEALP